jgi:hypothetical protein
MFATAPAFPPSTPTGIVALARRPISTGRGIYAMHVRHNGRLVSYRMEFDQRGREELERIDVGGDTLWLRFRPATSTAKEIDRYVCARVAGVTRCVAARSEPKLVSLVGALSLPFAQGIWGLSWRGLTHARTFVRRDAGVPVACVTGTASGDARVLCVTRFAFPSSVRYHDVVITPLLLSARVPASSLRLPAPVT